VLAGGREELERLFPSFAADLLAAGAIKFDYARDTYIRSQHGNLHRFDSGLMVYGCSRPLLDWLLVGYLRSNPKVELRDRTEVLGLLTDADKVRVCGVELRGEEGRSELLTGDLVADVTGRRAASISWLQALGFDPPRVRAVASNLGYACREYERPANFSADWVMVSTIPQAPHWARSAAVFPIEGQRWLAMLASVGDDRPTADDDAFLPFAATVGHPALYDLLASATPRTSVIINRTSKSQLRAWHRMRVPNGLVVLGDAVCALNPIYGHGITLATLGALALGDEIDRQRRRRGNLERISRTFQRKLFEIVRGPFVVVAGLDSTWPGATGAEQLGIYGRFMRSRVGRFMVASSNQKMHRIANDPIAMQAVLRIAHLSGSPLDLMRPRMLVRLLRQLYFRSSAGSRDEN
jgi:2-polyprenyl-6-methoxyphenol hydroxylase-like FAD-dependent oxidoreductase